METASTKVIMKALITYNRFHAYTFFLSIQAFDLKTTKYKVYCEQCYAVLISLYPPFEYPFELKRDR